MSVLDTKSNLAMFLAISGPEELLRNIGYRLLRLSGRILFFDGDLGDLVFRVVVGSCRRKCGDISALIYPMLRNRASGPDFGRTLVGKASKSALRAGPQCRF